MTITGYHAGHNYQCLFYLIIGDMVKAVELRQLLPCQFDRLFHLGYRSGGTSPLSGHGRTPASTTHSL